MAFLKNILFEKIKQICENVLYSMSACYTMTNIIVVRRSSIIYRPSCLMQARVQLGVSIKENSDSLVLFLNYCTIFQAFQS